MADAQKNRESLQRQGPNGSPSEQSPTQEIGDKAQQTFDQAKNVAQETAGTVMQQAQDQASMRISNGLEQAAGMVGSLSDALDSVGRQLRENEQSGLAGYAGQAAEKLDRFAGYLERSDVEDLVGQVERFARSQPAIFLGGAFAAGFLATRFLKSSAPRTRSGYPTPQLGSGRSGADRPTSSRVNQQPGGGYNRLMPPSPQVTPNVPNQESTPKPTGYSGSPPMSTQHTPGRDTQPGQTPRH